MLWRQGLGGFDEGGGNLTRAAGADVALHGEAAHVFAAGPGLEDAGADLGGDVPLMAVHEEAHAGHEVGENEAQLIGGVEGSPRPREACSG